MQTSKMKRMTLKFVMGIAVVLVAMAAVAQQYEILRADYGFGNQRVDVTQRLRDIAHGNSRFRMGNSTFGIDPSPNNVKTLRIFVRGQNGQTQTLEYREGSTVDGSQFVGWSGGRWGNSGYPADQGDFRGDRGGNRGGDEGDYTILHAEYGTERNHVDVTNRLRELARNDRNFRMGNSTFGVDPDEGRVKTLRIYARGPDGQTRMFEFREGSTVDGSQFRGWGRGDWGQGGWNGGWNGGGGGGGNFPGGDAGDAGSYVIVRAEYGTDRNHVDVTDRLRELARRDRTFRMGNSTFGVDPDHGRIKTLRIYARGPNGQERTFEYREGSTVDGSQFKGWGSGNWRN